MKRQWPNIFELVPYTKNMYGVDVNNAWISYLEQALSKEELDRIAPPICNDHEPLYYTEDETTIIYGGQKFISPNYFNCKCRHCGAEIKPSGWELK